MYLIPTIWMIPSILDVRLPISRCDCGRIFASIACFPVGMFGESATWISKSKHECQHQNKVSRDAHNRMDYHTSHTFAHHNFWAQNKKKNKFQMHIHVHESHVMDHYHWDESLLSMWRWRLPQTNCTSMCMCPSLSFSLNCYCENPTQTKHTFRFSR